MTTANTSGSAGAPGFHVADASRRLRFLRRRWKMVALAFILTTGTAVALSSAQEKQYAATAQLLFRDPQLDQTLFGSNFIRPSVDPAREAATNVRLVSLGAVARRTAQALVTPPLANRARRELAGRVLTETNIKQATAVAPEGQSDLVAVTFTDTSPRVAALVANTFARQYVEFRRAADRDKVEEAQRLVTGKLADLDEEGRNSREGRQLEDRAQQLEILSSLQTGNAELAQAASIPSAATSPRPIRTGIVGAFFGLLLGVGLAWLLDRLDKKLRDPQDAQEMFGRPLLGTIPQGRLGRRQRERGLSNREAESFMMLRASLRYFNVNRPLRSVLVTSGSPGEGKTSVSFNLAAAAAATGSRVLLIEADLRRPTVASYFKLVPVPGLTNMLAGDLPLEDVVQEVSVGEIIRGTSSGHTMDVVVAGPLPPNPADLIESERMRSIIARAEEAYDLVVIDTPPTSVVSDAIPLIQSVSGVIVVLRLGYTRRDTTQRLRDQLENLDAPLLGLVMNGARGTDSSYYDYSAEYAVDVDDETFVTKLNEHSGSNGAASLPAGTANPRP